MVSARRANLPAFALVAAVAACASPGIAEPAAFLGEFAAPDADLRRLGWRHAQALDDGTPARAAYRQVALQAMAAAEPMLGAMAERFAGTEPYRRLLAGMAGGLPAGPLVPDPARSDADTMVFATASGGRIVFVRRGATWRIDVLAALPGLAADGEELERTVLAAAEQSMAKLPAYRAAMADLARRIRAGEFADARAAAAAVAKASVVMRGR